MPLHLRRLRTHDFLKIERVNRWELGERSSSSVHGREEVVEDIDEFFAVRVRYLYMFEHRALAPIGDAIKIETHHGLWLQTTYFKKRRRIRLHSSGAVPPVVISWVSNEQSSTQYMIAYHFAVFGKSSSTSGRIIASILSINMRRLSLSPIYACPRRSYNPIRDELILSSPILLLSALRASLDLIASFRS